MNTLQQIRFIWKPIIFLICLLPAFFLVANAFGFLGDLGANPIEAILDRFGIWALRFIMITLAVTPLRHFTGWNWLSWFRRMFGLFAFFYASMHFVTWFVLDREMRLSDILEDLTERPFIAFGFAAVLILTALAVTSFKAIRRRMGAHWQTLHNAVYASAILAVWHYWWQVKKDVTEPQIYASILAILLGARIIHHWRRRKRRHQTAHRVQQQS